MTVRAIRQVHSYIGLFIAPSVLFFALTGAVQIFNLHEAHGNYHPAALVEKLSSVHKDQVFELEDHPAPPAPGPGDAKPAGGTAPAALPAAAPPAAATADGDEPALSTVLLKSFFLLVAWCLALSTSLGIWMALTQIRRRRTAWALLAAGALIPVGLLLV